MDYKIEQLRYQLREDPSSRVFYSLAEVLRRQGEAEEAAGLLRRGLEVHPRYATAWVSLGRCLRDLDDADGASEAFGRALMLDRSNLVAARAVAELAADRGDWNAAIEAYHVLSDALPDDAEVAAKLSDIETARAEEVAALDRLVAVPRVEVVRLSEGDPFADAESDEASDFTPNDVFGEMAAVAEVVDEPISGETVADFEPAAPVVAEDLPDEETSGEGDEPAFEATFRAGDWHEPAPESWADVTDEEDAESFAGELQVAPPPEDGPIDVPMEVVAPDDSDEGEPPTEIPQFDEPIIEEASDPPAEPEPETWSDLDEEPLAGVDPKSWEDAEAELIIPDTLAGFDHPTTEREQDPEREPVQPEDVPLPSLTLARLALQQGDHDLAEATLASLAERDPSNIEVVELLHSLREAPGEGRPGTGSAKVAALRGWLDTIRLASERQQK